MKIKKIYSFFSRCFLYFFIQTCFSGGPLDKSQVRMILQYLIDPEIRCFLNIISLCEGTSRQQKANIACFKPSWSEYAVSFGYKEKLDLKKYPNKFFCPRGKRYLCATASGRYQFIAKTWEYLIRKYNQEKIFNENKIFFSDFFSNIDTYYEESISSKYHSVEDLLDFKFGPFWQDFYAVVLLVQANLIQSIKNKNIEKICQKISFIWPSFPKNKFSENRYKDGVNNSKPFKRIVRLFELQMNQKSLENK